MGVGGFLTWKVTCVDGKLQHHEAVFEQGFAETRVIAPVHRKRPEFPSGVRRILRLSIAA